MMSEKGSITFRVLSYNTYLVPSFYVDEETITCRDQKARATAIGALIADNNVDFACLQEIWGADMKAMEEPLHRQNTSGNTYIVHPYCSSWGLGTYVDTAAQYLCRRGGLWMAHKGGDTTCQISLLSSRWYRYKATNHPVHNKCVHATRFQIGGNANRFLILLNTHLDPLDTDDVIQKQGKELKQFITDVLTSDDSFIPRGRGLEAKTSVLLVGDFNACANDTTHKVTKSLFDNLGVTSGDARDLLREGLSLSHFSSDIPLLPATYSGEENSLVVHKKEHYRLDWQIGIDRWCGTTLCPLKVEKHSFVVKQPKGHEVSDHWGVMLDLTV
eukprot:PhM_4_TR3714/c0_g1_i1/m.12261